MPEETTEEVLRAAENRPQALKPRAIFNGLAARVPSPILINLVLFPRLWRRAIPA